MTEVGRLAAVEEHGNGDVPPPNLEKPCRPAHRLNSVAKRFQKWPSPMLEDRERLLRGRSPVGPGQHACIEFVCGKEPLVADAGRRPFKTGQGRIEVSNGRVSVRLTQGGRAQPFHLAGIEVHVSEGIFPGGTTECCPVAVEGDQQKWKRLLPLPLLPQRAKLILPRLRLPVTDQHLKRRVATAQCVTPELRRTDPGRGPGTKLMSGQEWLRD